MIRSRVFTSALKRHLAEERQMVFVGGPRQVGKTTTCRDMGTVYLNWDNEDHREVVLTGAGAVARHADLDRLTGQPPVIVFDELHKYRRWRQFLKGFFDTYKSRTRIIVTGSSRLDQYRRGGDSLMGRYFPLRMHPFSVAELADPERPAGPIRPPFPVAEADGADCGARSCCARTSVTSHASRNSTSSGCSSGCSRSAPGRSSYTARSPGPCA